MPILSSFAPMNRLYTSVYAASTLDSCVHGGVCVGVGVGVGVGVNVGIGVGVGARGHRRVQLHTTYAISSSSNSRDFVAFSVGSPHVQPLKVQEQWSSARLHLHTRFHLQSVPGTCGI